jgi:hypothetical protein
VWPERWDHTNAFFKGEMVDVVRRIARPQGGAAQDRRVDVRKFLGYFMAMTGGQANEPDALCVAQCGLAFFDTTLRDNYEYIVVNFDVLQGFLVETMRRSGVIDFKIDVTTCKVIVKCAGNGHGYIGGQSGAAWEGLTRPLQQQLFDVLHRVPADLKAVHNSQKWGLWRIGDGRVPTGPDPRVIASSLLVTFDGEHWSGRLAPTDIDGLREVLFPRAILPPMSDIGRLEVRHAVTQNRARHRYPRPVSAMEAAERAMRDNGHTALEGVVTEGHKRELGHLCLDPLTFLTSECGRDIFRGRSAMHRPAVRSRVCNSEGRMCPVSESRSGPASSHAVDPGASSRENVRCERSSKRDSGDHGGRAACASLES